MISRARRSFIFTPGLKPEMFPKALNSGVDMVCVELEDGIAPKDKKSARETAIELFINDGGNEHVERILRINSIRTKFGLEDLTAVLNSSKPPPALMIPKVMDAEEMLIIDDLLTEAEVKCDLHPIIETNKGLENVFKIASSSKRIKTLFFGLIDMAAELRCKLTWEDLLYARSRVVHAAAREGIDAIDGPYLDLQDQEGLERYCEQVFANLRRTNTNVPIYLSIYEKRRRGHDRCTCCCWSERTRAFEQERSYVDALRCCKRICSMSRGIATFRCRSLCVRFRVSNAFTRGVQVLSSESGGDTFVKMECCVFDHDS